MSAHGCLPGDVVDIIGTMATDSNGERYIDASTINDNGAGTPLTPLGMNNRSLGGGNFACITGTSAPGQIGIFGASGFNNIGVLVRTWGKVTALDPSVPPQWFTIDDGSGVLPTVAYPPYGYSVGNYACITGISSCEIDNDGNTVRVLRPQPLTCTINQASGQSDPTNTTPINFTVIFSQPVTDFNSPGDVSITGTAGGTENVAITQTDQEGMQYNVAVSNLTYGTVIPTVPAGNVHDVSGDLNYASTSTDNLVSYWDGIVYVQTPANGGSDNNNSGWRWDNAKATVGAALQTAALYYAAYNMEAQVWVAKGTYNERITLPAGIALYGGFAGNEATTAQRPAFPRTSPDDDETIIDGQYGGDVVTASSSNFYNGLDGFTIQHGNNGVNASSVLPIYNCKITANTTGIEMTAFTIIQNNEVSYNTGDGINLSTSSGGNVFINNIHNNTNCGISCTSGGSYGYNIDRNHIEYNNIGNLYPGGGVSCIACASTPTISNNFIRGNGATNGGGIYCVQTTANVYSNTIVDNVCSSVGNGAGVYIRNYPGQSPYICNNIVAYNNGGYGLYIDNHSWNFAYTVYLLKNCTYQNASGNYGTSGSGATFNSPSNDHQNMYPGLGSDMCHLAADSQCINSGSQNWNGIPRYVGPDDIDGDPRIVGGIIDVGCDEVQ